MATQKPKKFTYFIGIDVSRNELDYAVMQGNILLFHQEGKNEIGGITQFVIGLKKRKGFTISKAIFCMENTGIYCNHILTVLKQLKANAVVENPLRIKNSSGIIRGKYDKIDAIRIALYAYTNRDNLVIKKYKRPIIIQLSNLFSLRQRLLSIQSILKKPIKEHAEFSKTQINKDSIKGCRGSITAIEGDLKNIESGIEQLIQSDEQLNSLNKIIMSVPYIGKVTSMQILITTNEFKDINSPKKFACYAGVAPFKKESGTAKSRAKVSSIANKRVKSLLHICAMGASKKDEELAAYYDRKIKEGKHKMSVINAVRYKLILRVFACVKQNRSYLKTPALAKLT